MDCFVACAPRNDDLQIQLRALAARFARVLQESLPLEKQRAQGKPGARRTRGPCALVESTG